MQYRIRNGDQLIATVTNQKSFHWAGLTPNTTLNLSVTAFNGLRESAKATVITKTRGIRVSVPTNVSVGTNVWLHYQEYSLGLVPIGTEPNGMFGGGSKQEVPAKVISSGSISVLEITNSFNLMKDGLTMKQLEDGSFAVFDGYKALYFKKG